MSTVQEQRRKAANIFFSGRNVKKKLACRGSRFSTLVIIFVHYVARSFCETIKLPQEMPKIAKCLKCLKLRNSIDLIKRKKQDM
jgi:hypothetical protein